MSKFIYGTLWFLLDVVLIAVFFLIAFAVVLLIHVSVLTLLSIFFVCGWFCHASVSYIERKRKVRVLVLKIKDKFGDVVEDIQIKEE